MTVTGTGPAPTPATRQRREHPLLVVHTGAMKGKSTAAFGMALRAWSAGIPITVVQFVKSGKWRSGEEAALSALGEVHARTGEGAPVEWHVAGHGASWSRTRGTEADHAAASLDAWREVRRRLETERRGFHVLDEFTYPLAWGWVDVDEVVSVLRGRAGFQHVVITGRNADPRIVELADLVAEVVKVKHPKDAGRRGQRGVEW
jgi:cob(I)alamin adenosyltransferase